MRKEFRLEKFVSERKREREVGDVELLIESPFFVDNLN